MGRVRGPQQVGEMEPFGRGQGKQPEGDGAVSRTEFSGPADHFDRLDLNGDGAIQESEARQGPPGMPLRNRKNQ